MLKWFGLVFLVALIFLCTVLVANGGRSQPDRKVFKIGLFEVGGDLPLNFRPGDGTIWAPPYETIPASRFFVYIAQDETFCVWEDCGIQGAIVQGLGGYLAGESLWQPVTIDDFGFDDENIRSQYKSAMVIADQRGKIVGVYLNRGMADVIETLHEYPEVVDFGWLKGVDQFGPLKIGQLAPVRPGDPTGYRAGELTGYPYDHSPIGKIFYVHAYSAGRMPVKDNYCAFYECLGFGRFDYVEELGGWYSNDGDPETMKRFGLNPSEVYNGKRSLVVITDQNGVVVAIHPDKTIDQIIGILWQLPNLADVGKLYKNQSWLSELTDNLFKWGVSFRW